MTDVVLFLAPTLARNTGAVIAVRGVGLNNNPEVCLKTD